MTDRELLERAAKAAGIRLEWDGPPDEWCPMYYEGKTYHAWEPLTDDGDAFRLAVRLGIRPRCVEMDHAEVDMGQETDSMFWQAVNTVNDAYAATRRAIVRAAAHMAGDTP